MVSDRHVPSPLDQYLSLSQHPRTCKLAEACSPGLDQRRCFGDVGEQGRSSPFAGGVRTLIYFVVKRAHRYCVAALASDFEYPLPSNTALAYEDLFESGHAAPGTYVFGDIERLSDAELNVAADIATLMTDEPGFQVLNHPARVRTRYGFLRAMREAGLNDFDAYRADGFPRPQRFPVFVRSEAAHIAPLR